MKAAGRSNFGLEDGVSMFLRNIEVSLQAYAVLQPRRLQSGVYFAVLSVIYFLCP
jgi:hypothetical protein